MKKTLLSLAIAGVCFVGAQAVAETTPTGNTTYDRAINLLGTDTSVSGRERALATMEQALSEGDGRAAMRLGTLALQNVQADGDVAYAKAISYYSRAVDLDTPDAWRAYAVTSANRGYFAGKDTPLGKSLLVEAYGRLVKATAAGESSRDVLWHLGFLEVTGLGGQIEPVAGYDHILAAADKGHGQAALWIANRYAAAIPSAPEGELKYLEIASNAGIASAKTRLTAFHDHYAEAPAPVAQVTEPYAPATPLQAMGAVSLSAPTAVASVSVPASASASSESALEVQALRLELASTNRQLAEARALLAAAEKRSGIPSDIDLANINHEGLEAVLAGNYELAVVRFREAAKYDYPAGVANLGLMYLNATGVPRDGRQAVALFERAAKKGNLVAAENIARAYDFGLGVHQDRSRAIKWYEAALRMGSPTAGDALLRLRQ